MPLYPKSKLLYIGTRVVTISVGIKPDSEDFTVHEKIIRESSTFIDATLLADQSEHTQRAISLTDFKPRDFKIYMQWLYTERVLMEPEDDGLIDVEAQNLIKGYLLGCHLGDENYRDTIMDFLLEWNRKVCHIDDCSPVYENVKAVFDSTELDDPLRKFMVDLTVMHASFSFWALNYEEFPDRFVAMVSLGYSCSFHYGRGEPTFVRAKEKPCLYHCHGDNTCYTKRLDRIRHATSPPCQPMLSGKQRQTRKRKRAVVNGDSDDESSGLSPVSTDEEQGKHIYPWT